MGGGTADERTLGHARTLGRLIAERGWVLLNGGRACGVMDASAAGAHEAGGLTVGVVPDEDPGCASEHLDVVIASGIGHARNLTNVLSSRVVVACRGEAGTLSEIALALNAGRPVVALDFPLGTSFERWEREGLLVHADSPETAVAAVERYLESGA
ncbi:MAG: DNA-binding protein [Actinobacteria bacterium]|nr:MAG: DNA-binding protein [Actinomycetota bacterium]